MSKKLTTLIPASLIIVVLTGCVVGDRIGHSGNDVYSTFGNISVKDGERAGDLENNSGNITVGRNAKVKAVDITNGNIDIGEFSEAYSLSTVNGNIYLGKNAMVTQNIKAVNGKIDIQPDTLIGANIMGANGDIAVGTNAIIKGDIIFDDSLLSSITDKTPTLTIAEGVVVEGEIHLYRKVNVTLPDSFNTNKVINHLKSEQ